MVLLAAGLCQGVGLLHHHFVKKLIGKKIFHKLRAQDKCDVVWEEVSHPHCQTTWEMECKPWSREACSTEQVEECKDVVERNCQTSHEEKCMTEYRDKCETMGVERCQEETEQKCRTDWVDECWEEDQQNCRTNQECSTVSKKVCSKIFQWVCTKTEPKPKPQLHEHARTDTVHSNPIRSLFKRSIDAAHQEEEEDSMVMFEKFEKLPTKDLLRLVDEMAEEDFREENEEETLLMEKHMGRSKRSALTTIAGAIGISSLYKKFLSTQDNCYKKKMPHCAEVPVESCYDVQQCETVSVPRCKKEARQKCWEEPSQKCWIENKENCWQEPEENCWQVPHENCWDETVQKCWKKPQQHCQQVEEEKCTEVPRENCKDVMVKVAKNYCNKKDLHPIEALSKIIDH